VHFYIIPTSLRGASLKDREEFVEFIDSEWSPWAPLFFVFNWTPISQAGRRGFDPPSPALLVSAT